MIYLIKKIDRIEPYRLRLLFNTGEIKTVDLYTKLIEWSQSPESKFTALLDPEYFSSVKLDPELDTIFWDNGIDLSPEVLYAMAE
jgi:hypothetical protein